jgi:hypothetical protein
LAFVLGGNDTHRRWVPRGDGRPVILLPGFDGGDQTVLVLAG